PIPRLPKRLEPYAIGWKSKPHPKLVFEFSVRYPLVLRIKTARQGRQIGGLEILFWRRLNSHQHRGIHNDILRRRGRIVADIKNAALALMDNGGINCAADVFDMNAVGDMAALHDTPRGAGLEAYERIAARPVNSGKTKNINLLAL